MASILLNPSVAQRALHSLYQNNRECLVACKQRAVQIAKVCAPFFKLATKRGICLLGCLNLVRAYNFYSLKPIEESSVFAITSALVGITQLGCSYKIKAVAEVSLQIWGMVCTLSCLPLTMAVAYEVQPLFGGPTVVQWVGGALTETLFQITLTGATLTSVSLPPRE